MKKYFIGLFIVSLIFIFFFILFNFDCDDRNKTKILNTDKQEKEFLLESLLLSQKWFDGFQTDENIMTYSFSPSGDELEEERNIVRELGSFWGYTRLYNINKNEASLERINKTRRILDDYIKYDKIEGQEIAYLEHDEIAMVNTQAFYLLAMAELVKAGLELSEKEKSDLKKIINGLYLMKADEGGLWYIYYLPKEHNKISPYGTSEGLYGLISYYKYIEQDEEVLDFAKLVFDEYYEVSKNYSFADEEARSFYSWILYFLTELAEIDPSYYPPAEELLSKALGYRRNNDRCSQRGCLMFPVTASEAAFLEGGIFVYPLLEKNNFARLEEVREYLRLAIDDVLSMQILSLDDYTEKTGDIFEGDPKMIIGAYCGGLNDGAYFCQYLRNDITQHASSAILNYYQIIDSYSF